MRTAWGRAAGLLILLAGTVRAQSSGRANSPVVVEAKNLPAVLTSSVSSLRLLAARDGRVQVIPFQIDERLEVTVYQRWSQPRRPYLAYATNAGAKIRSDYDPAFDANDQLAFMSGDAGQRVSRNDWPAGATVCAELQIADPEGGEPGYAYLCAFEQPPPLSPKSYVSMDDSARVFTGQSYRLGFPAQNPVNFDHLEILGPEGASANLVDRFKTRYDIGVALGLTAYSLTEGDFTYYPRGIKVGPIRIIVETESVLESWANAQIRVINNVFFYSDHVEFLLHTRPPGYYGPVNISSLTLALDLRRTADQMTFLSEKNPRGETVDGALEDSELKMDYGPNEWTAVTGKPGTILSYLALPVAVPLPKDLYYFDNAQKPDPPENEFGMFGKFGFTVRHLEKIGYQPQPLRMVYWFRPEPYAAGMEKQYLAAYQKPLRVITDERELLGLPPAAPPAPDTRKAEDKPVPTSQEKPQEQKITRALLPNFWMDPYNIGYGGGPSYVDADLFGTGALLNIMFIQTDRNFQWYQIDLSKIPGTGYLENLRFFLEWQQFPSESWFGQGNETIKDHRTLYWWHKYEASLTFSKHFADHYGLDSKASFRHMSIDPGQQARSGGIIFPQYQEHFGFGDELRGERWGPPIFGRQGGFDNMISLSFYRDFRDDFLVAHRGNYQQFTVDFVNPAIGSSYAFTRLQLDLRGYVEPAWLNHLPMDEWFNSRRTLASKFFGPDKRRSLAGRVVLTHMLAQGVEFHGRTVPDVPFYDLTELGGGKSMRGYFGNRFRDHDAAWVNLEYRWAWWKFIDAALFVDTGIVMPNLFEMKNWQTPWHWGYGFVVRIHVPPAVMATFDIGYSTEEQNYMAQPNWAF